MRFLLALLAARSSAGFVSLSWRSAIRSTSRFEELSPVRERIEGHTLLLPIVVAIIAYVLLHLGDQWIAANVRASQDSRFSIADCRLPIADCINQTFDFRTD